MQPNPAMPIDLGQIERIPPELLEWARQSLDIEEFLREVQQLETTGGCSFESLITEVEARVRGE